jgi:hypothetical protein
MNSKIKYLFKNFSFLLIGNFSSKILNFFLVPLYTYTLTTEEYGSYDIVYDTILLLIPILSLNITDAVMRFTIDSDDERKRNVIKTICFIVLPFYICYTILQTRGFSSNPYQYPQGNEDQRHGVEHPQGRVGEMLLFYCLRCHIGSAHCFCGLKILILNGSGLQIQTIGKVANPDQRLAAEHPLQQKFRVTYY